MKPKLHPVPGMLPPDPRVMEIREKKERIAYLRKQIDAVAIVERLQVFIQNTQKDERAYMHPHQVSACIALLNKVVPNMPEIDLAEAQAHGQAITIILRDLQNERDDDNRTLTLEHEG